MIAKGSQVKKTKPLPQKAKPRCGLCGKTSNLTKTDCCQEWICDDEHKYKVFSYARNSCHRNHVRFTLCSFHHKEGHHGKWQDCRLCRDSFDTEIYVWYGTNEYNYEKLADPPAYKPKQCGQCKCLIVLSRDGYSRSAGEYFCTR